MVEAIAIAILMGAGLVVISVFTGLVSYRVGAPLLLVFLCIGLLAGEDGIGGIQFNDAHAAYFIGSVALAVILFDSGTSTRMRAFRMAAAPSIILASLGVFLTAAILAVPIHYILDIGWLEAFLLGSIVSSTDAAAVFFLLRIGRVQIREKIRATLEIESGSNDPMAIFLTLTTVELILAGATNFDDLNWLLIKDFLFQMGLGVAIGVAAGHFMVRGINRIRLEPGLYPIIIVSLSLLVFAVTSLVGGSGFLAVYIAGLVMGNMPFRGAAALRRFQDGLTWLAQITMFLMLGLLATPSEFLGIAGPAILVGVLLILVARPLAVWLCLIPFGFTRNETAYIAWVGLRGAVSILLAVIPVVAGLASSQLLFNVAFLVVLVSLLVQGWTVRGMARHLGLTIPPQIGPVEKVELELPGNALHELVAYRIASDSPVAQGKRIPRWARPSLVVRNGRSMRIHEAGRPQAGDYVYIFVLPRYVSLLDGLFAKRTELSPKEDREFFGDVAVAPDKPIGEIAAAYGFEVEEGDAEAAVSLYMQRRLGNVLERGDRLLVVAVELIVREVDAHGRPVSIGLAFEPKAAIGPRLPLFQNYSEIVASLRGWVARRRDAREARREAIPVPPRDPAALESTKAEGAQRHEPDSRRH